MRIVQADGGALDFKRGIVEPDSYWSVEPQRGKVVRGKTDSGLPYEWQRPDGRSLRFDGQGS